MKNNFFRFYLCSCIGIVVISFYPLLMGIRTVCKMLQDGVVQMEDYPKYIIPYTPISVALILGVILIPFFNKIFKRLDFLVASSFCVGIFFLFERLMETKILVQSQEPVMLESWQMSLCYVAPQEYQSRTWEAVDILLGGYSPAFKMHFYMISVVLILSILNCFYGFAQMLRMNDWKRKMPLLVQSISSVAFLGMCIWACFTSFYRTGEITVSALSSVLMAVFFILLGVTMGTFTGSFLLGKRKIWSVFLPALVSSLITLIMYIGEMILLSGHLYRFGTGFIFKELSLIVLAPIDIVIILLSGCITAVIFYCLNRCAER